MSSPSSGQRVQLYLYDLTHGMAKAMSPAFLGRQIDGVWHTGLVVYGHEYYYGGGIQYSNPGSTLAGKPHQILELGFTDKSPDAFHAFLRQISSRFTPETYSLLRHNCNHFTNECSKFLLGKDIPSYIVGLPEEILSTPMGQMMLPMITQMENQMKQSQGSSIVPWQESSSSALNLPAISAANLAASAASSSSAVAPTTNGSNNVSASASAKPSTASGATERKLPDHLHAQLPLQEISPSSRPLLSTDEKQKSFATLIKANSKKSPSNNMSDAQRDLLAAATSALDLPSAPLAQDQLKAICDMFDEIIPRVSADSLFPWFGLFRLWVLRNDVSQFYSARFKEWSSSGAFSRLVAVLPSDERKSEAPMPAQLMSLCALSNLFAHSQLGSKVVHHEQLLNGVVAALSHNDIPMRTMAANILYNIALQLPSDESEESIRCVTALTEAAQTESDGEVCTRVLLALGHVIFCRDDCVALAMEFRPEEVVKRFNPAPSKMQRIAKDISTILATLQ